MSQITLRGIPERVERAIRRRAAEEHKSINRTIAELLQQALGIDEGTEKQRHLSDLAGTWSQAEAEEFERATAAFEQIDEQIWQ